MNLNNSDTIYNVFYQSSSLNHVFYTVFNKNQLFPPPTDVHSPFYAMTKRILTNLAKVTFLFPAFTSLTKQFYPLSPLRVPNGPVTPLSTQFCGVCQCVKLAKHVAVATL